MSNGLPQAIAVLISCVSLVLAWERSTAQPANGDPFSELVSFEALYELSLADSGSSGIMSYEGVLRIGWQHECNSVKSSQRIAAQITNTDGEQVFTDFDVRNWESVDGKSFQFNSISKFNGEIEEEIDGKARRSEDGEPGKIKVKKPARAEYSLPAEAMFPSFFTVDLLRAAAQGGTTHESDVFDGSDEGIIYRAATVIGAPSDSVSQDGVGADILKGVRSWPMQVGYYNIAERSALPEFQLGLRMFENGIGTQLRFDYTSFALDGRLMAIRLYPDPDC